jgi:hypothetical protein
MFIFGAREIMEISRAYELTRRADGAVARPEPDTVR